MPPTLFGPGLVMVFALSQAFRDVYFANAFQGIDFFAVILIAFSITTVLFGAVTALREPASFAAMWRERSGFLWMNVTTAVAWTSYFFALKHLQPSIVNTLHSGVGPLVVLALAASGVRMSQPGRVNRIEIVCYAGLAFSLALLCWVVLAGHSGLRQETSLLDAAALAALLVGGTAITISLLISRQLNERGIGADALSATRYWLIMAVALIFIFADGRPSGIETAGQFTVLAVVTTVLIVLPLYSLQLGVARTAPLTAQVIRALSPAFIFILELIDGRIAYSSLTLFGILLYSAFAIAGSLAHGLEKQFAVRRSRREADQCA